MGRLREKLFAVLFEILTSVKKIIVAVYVDGHMTTAVLT